MSHALIIEDEYLLAMMTEEALSQLDYSTFDIAKSLAEAIAAAEKQCPDLIVADHRIIDGTGTDAVLTICSDRVIPVVFLTSSEPEVRERLPNAIILSKPLEMTHFKAAVIDAVDRPFTHPRHDRPPSPSSGW